ncbi:hypothetical protein HYH02_003457 [Chlamydomonas schloesseri]|uniref:Signal peptidase complex subunit 1 n=1 Tax=Chlamydomonas schloesseri TaxID=2026947 RepID=A0A835WPU2_9CHLO|nr:hypothetical protein HYH02_003457 [Chlamydomonas schloesseri]|eukprot:KAG2451677.1 hypothetical protein HYH02_003457 [Chlamydomonas schloesseri]
MDFIGQRNAENALMVIVIIAAVISFIAGYAMKDFSLMVKINGVGLALALLVSIPDWPIYNRNPWKWLPDLEVDEKAQKKK